MKYFILCVHLLAAVSAYGQGVFSMAEQGLTPKFDVSQIDHLSQALLFEKTLTWIAENQQSYELVVDKKTDNEAIDFSSTKGNAVTLNEKYYYAKYSISITFDSGQYKFEPTAIALKVNSKYDMGWKEFDLTNTALYFKKGKVIRKYKAYISDMTVLLNELNSQLATYLAE